MVKRWNRDAAWLVMVLVTASSFALASTGFWLALDLRTQIAKGITFTGLDGNVRYWVTFEGSTFIAIAPHEPEVEGTFAFSQGRIVVLTSDIHPTVYPTLTLEPAPTTAPGRFALRYQDEQRRNEGVLYGPVPVPESNMYPVPMPQAPPPPLDSPSALK
jgi:hypothetical protein